MAFPVDAFLGRIQRLAEDTASALESAAAASDLLAVQQQQQQQQLSTQRWQHLSARPPQEVVAAVQSVLFAPTSSLPTPPAWVVNQPLPCVGFSAPLHGRSALPAASVVDHPGVREDARLAYLNEALVRRRGCPAALAVLLAEVLQRLAAMGALSCAAAYDFRDWSCVPSAVALPGLRVMQQQQQQQPVLPNTCSSECLAELLRLLKRAYWPWPWDTNVDAPAAGGNGSHGGFRCA